MMKKIIFAVLALFTSINFAATPTAEKLNVILDWFPNPDHAPLVIAQQQGFFKEQGLDVNLIGPADPNDPPKLVAAGKADIGITYEPQFMEQVDRGLPLIRIGTLIDKPLNCLVALKDSGIKNIADLKGKDIGATNGGLTSIMLKTMLKKEGLAENDVALVNVRYNLTQALLTHKVKAVTGMMRNVEVPMLEAKDKKVVTFFPEENGIPTYSELIFVSHINNVHDKRFPRFLAAIKKAVRYMDEHPQQSWQIFAAKYPESNNAVNKQSWFATMPYFAEDPADFNGEEWKQFANFMQKNSLIKQVQPVSRYAVLLEDQA